MDLEEVLKKSIQVTDFDRVRLEVAFYTSTETNGKCTINVLGTDVSNCMKLASYSAPVPDDKILYAVLRNDQIVVLGKLG